MAARFVVGYLGVPYSLLSRLTGMHALRQMRSWGNASMFVVEWARMPHYAGGACLRVLDMNACMKRSHFQLQVTLHSTFAC
eukprot:COSAG01_NODE_4894_length_4642_cov_13.405191_6_plen_81_part_00